ncbi:MAG: LacI family transcriptional regulator [Treponema sp.]|nr:LacI family transcriptional regulator [Treponema sp.]
MRKTDESKKTVTQNDVAKAAGVTRSMVSYVISGTSERSVAPETRERILKVIKELGYRPNKAAQALQLGDVAFASKNIGVVLPNSALFLRPFYTEILEGIFTAAHEHNYNVKFIRFFDELKDPVLFNELIHPESIGSLILLAVNQAIKTEEDEKILKKTCELIKKTVCVEWKMDGLTSVLFDRQESSKKAVEYLIKKGYSQIAYVGENDERVFGVQQALLQKNLNAVQKYFYLAEGFDMQTGYEGMKSIGKKNDGKFPRAIVCGSDEVAVGAMCYLNEKGIKIPEEVAIISIDNIELAAYANPPLTTINVQKKAMGYKAVEMIINGSVGQGEEAVCITLPTEIIERKSC